MDIFHLSNLHIDTSAYTCAADRADTHAIYNHTAQLIRQRITANRLALIVIAGDVFQHRSELRKWDSADFIRYIRAFSCIAPTIIIPGVHDTIPATGDQESVDLIAPLLTAIPNVHYYNATGLYKHDGAIQIATVIDNTPIDTSAAAFIIANHTGETPYGDIPALLGGRHTYYAQSPIAAYPGALIQQSMFHNPIAGFIHWKINSKRASHEFVAVPNPRAMMYVQYANNNQMSHTSPIARPKAIRLNFRDCDPQYVNAEYTRLSQAYPEAPIDVADNNALRAIVRESRQIPAMNALHEPAIQALYKQHCAKLNINSSDPCALNARPIRFNLKSLAFDNVMVYGDKNSVNLPQGPGALIGITAPNSVGKSTFITALTLALYGKVERGDTETLIRTGCDTMTTTAEFESHNMHYEINRRRSREGTRKDEVKYYMTAQSHHTTHSSFIESSAYDLLYNDSAPAPSTAHHPAFIINNPRGVSQLVSGVIGDYDLAVYSCIAQQKTRFDILRGSPSQQRCIFERFLGLTPIIKLKHEADAHYKSIETQQRALSIPCIENAAQLASAINDMYRDAQAYAKQQETISAKIDDLTQARDALLSERVSAAATTCTESPGELWAQYRNQTLLHDYIQQPSFISESPTRDQVAAILAHYQRLHDPSAPKLAHSPIGQLTELQTFIAEHRRVAETVAGNVDKVKDKYDELTAKISATRNSIPLEQLQALELKCAQIITLLANATRYESACKQVRQLQSALIDQTQVIGALTNLISVMDYGAYEIATANIAQVETQIRCLKGEANALSAKRNTIGAEIAKHAHLHKMRADYEDKVQQLLAAKRIAGDYKKCILEAREILLAQQLPLLAAEINSYLSRMEADFRITLRDGHNIYVRKPRRQHDKLDYTEEPVFLTGGYQYDLINALMRVALWRLYRGPMPNFLVFDETFAQADSTNLRRLLTFMREMDNPPQFILINSHNTDILNVLDFHVPILHHRALRLSRINNSGAELPRLGIAHVEPPAQASPFTTINGSAKLLCVECKKEVSALPHILNKHLLSAGHLKSIIPKNCGTDK